MVSPLTLPMWSDDGVAHGFFTREGGVSQGGYASLNCRYGSNDNQAHVSENRALVARALGVAVERLAVPYQVHSARAVVVTEDWVREDSPQADAVVTATPGISVAVLTADCVPVLFVDREAGVVGAAHAGWQGAKAGIIDATITKMEELGGKRGQIEACVGPGISAANYEVGPEFEQAFLEDNPDYSRFFHVPEDGRRAHFDLPAYVLNRLAIADLGVIKTLSECTYQHEERYFSYRRATHRSEPDYGCQISAIALK